MGVCSCIMPKPNGCQACNPDGDNQWWQTYQAPQTGWICPKCQAVMAPNTPMCIHCKPVIPPLPNDVQLITTPTPRNDTLQLCVHERPIKFGRKDCYLLKFNL